MAALLVWLVADHVNLRAKIAEMREDIKLLRASVEQLAGDTRHERR